MGVEAAVAAVRTTTEQEATRRTTSVENRRNRHDNSTPSFPSHSTSNSPNFTVEQERTCFGISSTTVETCAKWMLGICATFPSIDKAASSWISCYRIMKSVERSPLECGPAVFTMSKESMQDSAYYLVPFTTVYLGINQLQRLNLVDPSRSASNYASIAGLLFYGALKSN